MQMQSTPVGGRERKDRMPVTVGVPPVSSGTEDPFNLSTLPPEETHISQRALSSSAKTARSQFAFETDDLTYTTWFLICLTPSLFRRNVTQREPITLQHLSADQMQNQHTPFHINGAQKRGGGPTS